MPKKPSDFLEIIIIFAVYLVTAILGLKLDPVAGFATLVWLPTGISLAVMLIFGFKVWPAIALAAFFANFLTNAPPLVALGISTGNTLEAVVGVFLLKKIGFRNTLDRLKDVVMLIVFATFLSTLISATIGVISLWLGGIITLANLSEAWLAWWVGDMVSDLVVAPFILVWSVKPNLFLAIPLKRLIEGVGLALFITVFSIVTYKEFFNLGIQVSPRSYIVFPLLIWAALRFGTRGAVTTTFILSIISVWITSLGFGPFISQTLHQSLLSVQVYIGVVSITALVLAAIASERKDLEERKDEFISIASHELKTPITSIKGYIQILRQFLKESQNEKLLAYTHKMDQQIDRLTKLVNDLLDVSKIQSGKLELQLEEIDLNELIEDTITDLQLINNNHKIIFEKGQKRLIAYMDEYLISEVLINLISNAIKYSPRADQVIVRTTRKQDNVITEVEDFGIGISRKDQEKVFKKFFRADNRIRQSFSGLGLGLYISSEIVKKHQGHIWISSIKGKGTTISFKLPAGKGISQ